MATRVVDQPIKKFEGETLTVPASNGTRDAYNIRPGYQEILIEPVAAMRLQFVPKITSILFYDSSNTKWTDILKEYPHFLDRTNAVDVGVLSGMTTADSLYIGTAGIVGGERINVGTAVNNNTADLTAAYSPASGDWTSLTVASDGTASGGATLAQDGLVLFTVPTNWGYRNLTDLSVPGTPPKSEAAFWQKLTVSALVDTPILLENLTVVGQIGVGIDSTTAATGGIWLKATTEYTMDVAEDVGALEIMAQAASATTARVTWIRR